MSIDQESRIQALEWLLVRLATDLISERKDPLGAAQAIIADSDQLTATFLKMADDNNADQNMRAALLDHAGARQALLDEIYEALRANAPKPSLIT